MAQAHSETSNVIPLGDITSLDIPADMILENAKGNFPDGVMLIGFDEGGELYFASSIADGGTVLWALEKAKQALLEVNY